MSYLYMKGLEKCLVPSRATDIIIIFIKLILDSGTNIIYHPHLIKPLFIV